MLSSSLLSPVLVYFLQFHIYIFFLAQAQWYTFDYYDLGICVYDFVMSVSFSFRLSCCSRWFIKHPVIIKHSLIVRECVFMCWCVSRWLSEAVITNDHTDKHLSPGNIQNESLAICCACEQTRMSLQNSCLSHNMRIMPRSVLILWL